MRTRSAIAGGAGLALLAALGFGLTTPFVERAGRGLGPLTTAALLYAGAALSALAMARLGRPSGAPLRGEHAGRLLAIALVGAGVAPTLFAWGLQRTGATLGSLLLNLEAGFTVLLARSLYREPIGGRVALALGVMALGGAAAAGGAGATAAWSPLGVLAVAAATAAWALDNALTRALAEHDPVQVVAAKGGLGAAMTGAAALALAEPLPEVGAALALLACGATGYGLSLRLYLLAQRRIGAARTASIFAVAPFLGAGLSWALGDRTPGPWAPVAAALFGLGVALHLTERHHHAHAHPPVEHEHAHRHDDGHHDHGHATPMAGEHSHPHPHPAVDHDHDHAPDLHHDHGHS